MLKEAVGKRSTPVKNIIERGAVKKFAESIGDLHPLFIDEETGKNSRYQQNIAPPTFPRVLDYGTIEGFNLPNKGLIHGEQVYHYNRPLLVGEEVQCYTEIESVYERSGSQGSMIFLVLKNYGDDTEGNNIFSEKMVIIINEAVRKAMGL
ncbi:MaoC family dehydratase N-terminal domain-containing protein [Cytobacillus suaedae]|nr:MaoC family dehydratase N-terminal domain-containing protein [Cytobacillus suaedae]